MANPPPPYSDITGISRAVMKDNAQETLANYNGNARPGELVVNLVTDPPALYVGNNIGALTLISSGGGGGGLPLANGDSNFDIAVSDGNVTITVAALDTWTFDTNGTLTTPGDITVSGDITGTAGANTLVIKAQPDSNTYIQLNSIVDSTIQTYANLTIVTDSAGTDQTWRFGTDGLLTAPGNVRMGYIDASAVSQINTVANSSGDGNGYTTLQLIPDENLTGTDQYIILDPTAPGHIHVRAGGTQDASSADLIVGGEFSNFRVNAGSNAAVQVTANSQIWSFEPGGYATVPVTDVANLVPANTVGVGARGFVTDADTQTFANTAVGGGANAVPVYSDGTVWRIG